MKVNCAAVYPPSIDPHRGRVAPLNAMIDAPGRVELSGGTLFFMAPDGGVVAIWAAGEWGSVAVYEKESA